MLHKSLNSKVIVCFGFFIPLFDLFEENIMKRLLVISIVGAFLFALNPVEASAQAPSFFQGFEVDTSGWYSNNLSSVTRVPSGDPSTSYNGGSTSVYANAINAATGGFFARVTSAISVPGGLTGSCEIDLTGAIGPSLLCNGPFTYFGLKVPGELYAVSQFPPGGYTTQVDIYLDRPYATHHPDCTQYPCMPDTPGVDNPACTTEPNGIDCEGSRFDWAVALSTSFATNPADGADFLQDYVFSLGTAPAPDEAPGTIIGCNNGWIVTAGYNSFRSGGDTYNTGFDPRCISSSGWYTFMQVFKDDGGQLEVDYSILDQNGNVVSCTDENGDPSTCSWVLHPGHAISDVGCPRYGWLSNEEVNDLPIDNTALFIDGCGLTPLAQRTTPIPALSLWGLIAMAGLMGIVGFIVMRRKKATV